MKIKNKYKKLKITKIRSAKFYFHREMPYVTNINDDNHARNDNGDINYTVLVKLVKVSQVSRLASNSN